MSTEAIFTSEAFQRSHSTSIKKKNTHNEKKSWGSTHPIGHKHLKKMDFWVPLSSFLLLLVTRVLLWFEQKHRKKPWEKPWFYSNQRTFDKGLSGQPTHPPPSAAAVASKLYSKVGAAAVPRLLPRTDSGRWAWSSSVVLKESSSVVLLRTRASWSFGHLVKCF